MWRCRWPGQEPLHPRTTVYLSCGPKPLLSHVCEMPPCLECFHISGWLLCLMHPDPRALLGPSLLGVCTLWRLVLSDCLFSHWDECMPGQEICNFCVFGASPGWMFKLLFDNTTTRWQHGSFLEVQSRWICPVHSHLATSWLMTTWNVTSPN